MSTLTITRKHLKGRPVEAASRFPSITQPLESEFRSDLDECEGLFLGYGKVATPLPYTMQDCYDAAPQELSFQSAVLENDHLKAEIVIDLGGRLWSLYDKDAGRDLILDNHEFRPGNLAIRNAWFAGGVEWNIGRRGHDAQTCSPRFAAKMCTEDGTPVLRIYEFNRDGLTPFQLDFFLPDDSRFLFVRGRIQNQSTHVIPMYWWSNIAVEEQEGARVVVPTNEAYSATYHDGGYYITKTPIPMVNDRDTSYPTNIPHAHDFFYKIPEASRKYETMIWKDGYGLAHCSTSRLQGRKLFVWGQSAGGKHWQRNLMAPDNPDYVEIQGGIARNQDECLPMPPRTSWEWLEAYGPIQMAPIQCFEDWDNAVIAVTSKLNAVLPQEFLDNLLESTRDSIALAPAQTIASGSGWGALEKMRMGKDRSPHLDFGETGAEQQEWVQLLTTGAMDDSMPCSYMIQDEWFKLLKKAKPSWKVLYHLALNSFVREDMDLAIQQARHAMELNRNPWTLHLNAFLESFAGNLDTSNALFLELVSLEPDDPSLAKDVLKRLLAKDQYQTMLQVHALMTPQVRQRGMVRFLHAQALAHTGQLDAAEAILTADGGLEVPDIREGERSTSQLYIYIQKQRAAQKGLTLDEKDIAIPQALDFRMSTI